MADSGAEPWPLAKFRAALAQAASEGAKPPKGFAVVLTTGGLNPAHLGHVQLLHQARNRLEKVGYKVVGLWLSPSHDAYLQPKAKSLNTIGLSAGFRLEVSERAVAGDPLVAIGHWEAKQPGYWPDFPEVSEALQAHLAALPETELLLRAGGASRVQVFYACGTDHAAKCGLYRGLRPDAGIGIVVVPRQGEAARGENPGRMVYVAEPSEGDVASFSSTKVRAAIASSNFDQVASAMSPKAATFLLQPKLEEHSRFLDDFAKLGVTPPSEEKLASFPDDLAHCGGTPQPRRIYVSLSSLMREWDGKGFELLKEIPSNALFFFGSKRSWVFPENSEEHQESVKENSRYTKPTYQALRDLILEKESRGEVFFLKPPGFKYNGDLFHGDPGAFPLASTWIQRHTDPLTGKPFAPLLLDPQWWATSFKNSKYTRHVGTIVKNFQRGAHDYAPVMELLHQSNPTLEIAC